MNLPPLDGFVPFAASLLVFLALQRWLYRELQAVFLLITRRSAAAMNLFSLLLFPGVFLHELSHLLMALLLGVKAGRFSLIPRMLADGKIRLGYVETAATDPIRDTLIGAAPLISGVAVLSFLMNRPLGLLPLASLLFSETWGEFWAEAAQLPARPDFWLWFYLAFAISSTMVPSAADRRAWWSLGLFIGLMLILSLLPGMSEWLLENVAPAINQGLLGLSLIFVASGLIHLVLVIPALILRIAISGITGLRVG